MEKNSLSYLYSVNKRVVSSHGCLASVPWAVKYIELQELDWAEFGVASGVSTRALIKVLPGDINLHLFDSFKGLPEKWNFETGYPREVGCYAQDEIPFFNDDRVKMYVGWFEDTLPKFVEEHPEPLGFIHIDCDIYSSTKTIFDNIDSLIQPGTIILFDEYYNYNVDEWLKHEYKAFTEYTKDFEYLGRTHKTQVWVRMT